jgi:hypothetical protein
VEIARFNPQRTRAKPVDDRLAIWQIASPSDSSLTKLTYPPKLKYENLAQLGILK